MLRAVEDKSTTQFFVINQQSTTTGAVLVAAGRGENTKGDKPRINNCDVYKSTIPN